ncbi:MAG: LysM domain-containing protein [Candidatus Saccharimonadales bacterium]
MTEKTLFRNALIMLGSTIALPLVVGTTGLGAPGGASTNDLLKQYVASAATTSTSQQNKSDDQVKKDAEPSQNDTAQTTPTSDQTATTESAKAAEATPAGYAAAKPAGTYVVKAGDTYGCIAERYYGSYDQWSKVYAANGIYPGFEEYRLNVGATLQMPAVATSEVLPVTQLCK